MNIRIKLFLSFLTLFLGASLTGAALWVLSSFKAQTAPSWPLEGNKPGQASIWGRYLNSAFGGTVVVGDVNGDGFDDLIANAPYASEVIRGGGEVYVIPGPLSFHESYTLPQRAALVFQGVSVDDLQMGNYLDSGDLNGDRFDDIVMGSWTTSSAYVYLGSADIQAGSPITIAVIPENMAMTISPADGLAFCDINGDGYQDLFVEHEFIDSGIEVKVWGLLGGSAITMTNPVTLTLPADANVVIEGFHPSSWSSPSLKNMACGDIDGDGFPDLAIGIFGESPSYRQGAGIVYVIRGDPEITSSNPVTLTMPDEAGAIIEGVDGRLGGSGDELGASLASADLNRDGLSDLVMGAPGASGPDNLIQYAGEVYLWLGRALEGQRFTVSAQASWIVYGEESSDGLGHKIATGDFDQDGFPEVFLGCILCAREGSPLYLSGRGYVLEPLQITGFITVTAASQLDVLPYKDARCLGEEVDAMDLDGDGSDDLVLTAPCTDYPEGNLPGTVYVVSYPIHFRNYLPIIHR